MVVETGTEMERRAHARVGLLGNPSDVYGGRAVSLAVAGLWADLQMAFGRSAATAPRIRWTRAQILHATAGSGKPPIPAPPP